MTPPLSTPQLSQLSLPDWDTKCWGLTREIIHTQHYSKHELQLLAGGWSSIHYHLYRANRFILYSGMVEIVEFFGPTIRRTQLIPGGDGTGFTYVVPSLVVHMFLVHANGFMEEEYFPDRGGSVERRDIVRLCEGGSVQLPDLTDVPVNLLRKLSDH